MSNGSVRIGLFVIFMAVCCSKAMAEDDPLSPYRATQVTETVNLGERDTVKSIEIVKDSKISIIEKVNETQVPDSAGNLHLTARTTVTTDTFGSVNTVVEQVLPGRECLEIVSRTTVEKKAPNVTITTVETLDRETDLLQISMRMVVRNEPDKTVTTTETRNNDGNMVVSQTVTRKEKRGM